MGDFRYCPVFYVQASPGNLQQLEGVLFGHTDAVTSTCVMAVKLTNENGQRMVGVAYAEPSLHKLGVSEFLENDQFSNIEVGESQFITSL